MRLDAKRIMVPVNGDAISERAFRWACHTARESKADLHAIYVMEVPLELPLEAEITEDINRGEEILARIEGIAAQEKCKSMEASFLRRMRHGHHRQLHFPQRSLPSYPLARSCNKFCLAKRLAFRQLSFDRQMLLKVADATH